MRAADAGRLQSWLAEARVVDVDPPTVTRLRERLAAGGTEPLRIAAEAHGTLVVREPQGGSGNPRRVLELDRHGTVVTTLGWTREGRLAHAWIRVEEDSWVMIEPRATREAPWGLSDRLWHAAHPSAARVPLTVFEALAYESIDRIPALAEPARLPAGAGTAVLNLVAALAADAGRSHLAYGGPYPTEQLFLALLESFRYDTDAPDPLAAFMSGRVRWRPAPHERVCLPHGVTAHVRGRVEKVSWRGRLYHRPDWQGVGRHAPRRVRDVGGAVVCSLWALGAAVEDHLRLDAEGDTVEVVAPRTHTIPPRPMPGPVLAGVAGVVAALCAPPLAPFVRESAGDCELGWASLDGDLVATEDASLRVSHAFREALRGRLHMASTRAERLALGLAALTELAQLLGDVLRARAQTRLAALPPDLQTQHLTKAEESPTRPDDARKIARAVEALVADTLETSPGD